MKKWTMIIGIILASLAQSACKTPISPSSETELAKAQRGYLEFYTDPELLAQADAQARDLSRTKVTPPPTQMAMAPVLPAPAPVMPAPETAPVPVPAPQPKIAPQPVEPAPTVPATSQPAAVKPVPATSQPAAVKPVPATSQPAAVKPVPTLPKPPIKPIVIKSITPKPAPKTLARSGVNQPWLAILLREPSAQNASATLKDMTQQDVAAQVEAIRILCSLRPVGGEQELYITAFTHKLPFVREVAISALLRAYADRSDAWARRLLETRGGREEDRQHLAKVVIRSGATEAYPLAIEALGSDFTGEALFNARLEILEAGHVIVPSLTRLALHQKRTTSGRIARRLYRWIQNAGGIKEAYYDTFGKDASEYAVVLFRERYGDAAQPLLHQALKKAGPTMAQYIQQALEDLKDPDAAVKPRERSTASRAYLLIYEMNNGKHTILTDTPVWPNQLPGDTQEHRTDRGVIRQKSIGMAPEQLDKLRNLPTTAVPSVRVDGQTIDRLDMQKR